MSAGVQSPLNRAYNDFLYSPVSDDPDQMPVSVLSALARHDIDPWDEAAQLAHMPKSIAIARLTSMISAANSDLKAQSRAKLTAARLIELLPNPPLLGIARPSGIDFPKLPYDASKLIALMAVAAVLIALAVFGT
jgi:hypothetical protein